MKKEKSNNVEMVDGDEEKENDARLKLKSDDEEGQKEKGDEEAHEDEDEDEEGSSKKRKKKVTSCKVVWDSDLHISLGKQRFQTKVRISLQRRLHIVSLRYTSLTNCKRYPMFKVLIRCFSSLVGQIRYLNQVLIPMVKCQQMV